MTVFVTQEMRGRDLSDATTFGDLVLLIPAGEQVVYSTQPVVSRLERVLCKFTDDDYLVLAGDPAIISIAVGLVVKHNKGRYKLLKWDRIEQRYYPLEVNLYRTLEVA